MAEADPQPWERRPDESNEQWEAFTTYRDMGLRRSLRKTIEAQGKGDLGTIGTWSSKYGWVARTHAWDVEQDRLFVLELRDARVAAAKRNLNVARAAINLVSKSLVKMTNEDKTLDAADLTRMMDVATKLERMVLGEPSERVEVLQDKDVEAAQQVLLEQLKTLRDAAELAQAEDTQ